MMFSYCTHSVPNPSTIAFNMLGPKENTLHVPKQKQTISYMFPDSFKKAAMWDVLQSSKLYCIYWKRFCIHPWGCICHKHVHVCDSFPEAHKEPTNWIVGVLTLHVKEGCVLQGLCLSTSCKASHPPWEAGSRCQDFHECYSLWLLKVNWLVPWLWSQTVILSA